MNTTGRRNYTGIISALTLFAVAMAYLETAVVVYLRELYCPGGFTLTIPAMPCSMIIIEMFREVATLAMLATVALVVGRRGWERFGFLIFIWGVWDIFYYVWLKAILNWPSSLFEWDILFLLPIPWLGPVIAPVLVALLMVIFGVVIIRLYADGGRFEVGYFTWVSSAIATGLILYTFMRDYRAFETNRSPSDFNYLIFFVGWALYIIAFLFSYKNSKRTKSV